MFLKILATKNFPPIPRSQSAVKTVLPTSNLGSGTDSKFFKADLLIEKKLNKSLWRGVYDKEGTNSSILFFTFLATLGYSTSIGEDLLTGFGADVDEADLALSFLSADARMGVLLKMKSSWWEASTILSLLLVNFFLLNFFYFSDMLLNFYYNQFTVSITAL